MTQSRTRMLSKRNGAARVAARSDAIGAGDDTTAFLLIQLRKANRTILRLRACALAARDGSDEELRAALAALRPRDLGS